MKITTLNNLREFLGLMEIEFGLKSLSDKHRNALDTYVLNIDYARLEFNTNNIVGNNSPYVGNAIVGSSYVA